MMLIFYKCTRRKTSRKCVCDITKTTLHIKKPFFTFTSMHYVLTQFKRNHASHLPDWTHQV